MHHIATDKLNNVLKVLGITQGIMAGVMGVSTRSLNQWLKHADKFPDKASQDKIALAYPGLDLTRDDMLGPLPNG